MALKTLFVAALATVGIGLTLYLSSQESPSKTDVSGYLAHVRKYNKLMGSPQELEYRAKIFNDNMIFAGQVNKKQSSFVAGDNQLADLSFSEFSQNFLSKKTIAKEIKHLTSEPKLQGRKDWRAENKVTPVKNQGSCGSCWAFSAVATLEAAYAIKTGEFLSFSEQELVDCSGDYENEGCNGGMNTFALDYIVDNKIGLSKDYPYVARDQACKIKPDKPRYGFKAKETINPIDVSGLIKGIEETPVSVAIEVQRDFQMYKGGVYTNNLCGENLNHAVTAVGYVNEEGKDNQYFIVKNSWGSGWGEEGFVRMAIGEGSGTCGIASDVDVIPKF